MDYKQLATEITIFLSPFLPYLVLTGEATAKEIGKKFGESGIEKAKFLWKKVKGSIQESQKLDSVATALATDPNDGDLQIALIKILMKHFKESPELVSELIKIVEDDKVIQKILIEKGSRVKDIHQQLSKAGKQEAIIRDSEIGNITQEQ